MNDTATVAGDKESTVSTLDSLAPSALAFRLAETFRTYDEEIYLVGGAVRDQLLSIGDPDLDFATSSHPGRTAHILQDLGVAHVYRVGEKFGTIGAKVGEHTVEITTYRSKEVYPPGSRKPEVQFGRTLLEDLSRRDFTINAIARDPISGAIVDPLGGMPDLDARIVRAVGSPEDRFREDPLRLLRAVRFSSRLAFEIEPETWEGMRRMAPALEGVSRERIRDEYSKYLQSAAPLEALTLLRDAELLAHSVPQLLELTRMHDHGPRHPLSLWDHTMRVVSGVPPDLTLRWAALLHDIAKPATRTHEPSGRPRFFHHEEVGAAMAREILGGLRYPNGLVDDVATLVETHMHLHSYSAEWSDGAVRRLMVRLGPLLQPAILLARADGAGHALTGESTSAPKFDHLEERIAAIGRHDVETLRSPLSGNDLMERYGRPPGPWIRRIKDALLDEVLDGRLATDDRASAWKIADRLIGA